MNQLLIPAFCIPCIQRLQSQCPHLRITFQGGFHFSGGEVWDDICEVCIDCGAIFDQQPVAANPPYQPDQGDFS